MCFPSLHEAVTEKTCPTLAPLCVNNPYFLYVPYFPIVLGYRCLILTSLPAPLLPLKLFTPVTQPVCSGYFEFGAS